MQQLGVSNTLLTSQARLTRLGNVLAKRPAPQITQIDTDGFLVVAICVYLCILWLYNKKLKPKCDGFTRCF